MNSAGRPAILRWVLNFRILSVALLIAIWWVASGNYADYLLPGPDTVFESFWNIAVENSDLWRAMSISLQSLFIGGLLALSVGIILGVLMGAQRVVEHAFDLYVNGLYVAPVSALTPLLVFWFGIDLAPRVATVFIFSVPEIIITCYQGAKDTPRTYVEVARAFGANDRTIFWKVVIPNVIPFIITAMRLGLGRAIKGMVLAELIISSTGLGELIDLYRANFDTASLMAVLIVLMLLGVFATYVIRLIEQALVPWRETS
jgi:ABC-type nitrate/sulfonate/bicarbonate transport system permease component